jgi:ribulose 1,5-bisphosphate synthetase/thiazole synthase
MSLSEITITKAIVERFFHKFIECIDVDTAIVGAGPAGMSANAAFGGPRMGPIFGGMLLSGRRVSELILEGK